MIIGVDGKYVIGKNNPSGWLINIADNGSVTVPMRCQGSNKCKNCTSFLKRTIIDESANWDCDFDGCDEKIKQGDIVYECALNDKICDAVFHAKHFTKDTIIKENEILKPYRSKDKKKAIVGMGYDGYSFYISNRGDGRRYELKQFNHGPSSFREAWEQSIYQLLLSIQMVLKLKQTVVMQSMLMLLQKNK